MRVGEEIYAMGARRSLARLEEQLADQGRRRVIVRVLAPSWKERLGAALNGRLFRIAVVPDGRRLRVDHPRDGEFEAELFDVRPAWPWHLIAPRWAVIPVEDGRPGSP